MDSKMMRQVVFVACLSTVLTLALVAGLAWLLRPGWQALLPLHTQQMQVRLPEGAPVTVDIVEPLDTDLQTVIDVSFPIDEVLPVHFDGPIQINIGIDAEVPMRAVIQYEDVLPLDAEVTAHVLGIPFTVPVTGQIPVKLSVPVDQMVPLKFSAPVTVSMDEALQVPVKIDFQTQIPLNQKLRIPVNKPLETNIKMSERPVTVEMTGSELVMPLDDVRLQRRRAAESE